MQLILNHLRNPALKFGANRAGGQAGKPDFRGVTQAGGPTGHLDIWRERLSLSFRSRSLRGRVPRMGGFFRVSGVL